MVVKILKQMIINYGISINDKFVNMLYLPSIGKFIKDNKPHVRLNNRVELYKYINAEILRNKSIDYLEFGVYKGSSIKWWVESNKNSTSRFYGFDTFWGLPKDWNRILSKLKKGAFSTEGIVPPINDARVSFVKGVFQETLSPFLTDYTQNNRMVIHLDADLYESTLYVLTQIDYLMMKGTILIFDEFSSIDEYRAFINYVNAYRRKYKVIGCAGYCYEHIAIEIL